MNREKFLRRENSAGLTFSNLSKILLFYKTSVFMTVFLLIVSLSSIILKFNSTISLNVFSVSLIAFLVVLVTSSKRPQALILLLVLGFLSHLLSIYLLLPVGYIGDQRVYFIDTIKRSGRIESLEAYSYEGTYYTRYPIPWLIASSISMITGTDSQISWLTTFAIAYISFIIFLILLCTCLFKMDFSTTIAILPIIMMTTIYLHRPFHDLIPSSFGILSLTITLYLFALHGRRSSVLLALMIPLMIAHGLSIYVMTLLFTLLALFNFVINAKEDARRATRFAVIIFTGSWLYQVGSQLIDAVVKEVPYRLDQLLNTLRSPLFERPETPEIMAQNLHYIYIFDHFITLLAYAFPVLLTMASFIYFIYKVMHIRDTLSAIPLLFSTISSLMFITAGVFAWKGIENAIARYLYVYASTLSVLTNTLLLSSMANSKRFTLSRKTLVVIILLAIIGVVVTFESFYTPYASLLSIPDKHKFEKLYSAYYNPSMFNENLVNGVNKHILNAVRTGIIKIYSIDRLGSIESNILYNNGFTIIG